MHLVTTVTWHRTRSSVVSGFMLRRSRYAGRTQSAMQTVLCKRPPRSSNLFEGHTVIAVRHVALSFWDMIASSSSSSPRTSAYCFLFLFVFLSTCGVEILPPPQRSHSCLSTSHTRSVFESRFELLLPSVRRTPSYLYAFIFLNKVFLLTYFSVFLQFLTNFS